ncbi:MAG TPA: hypothetical protein EYQ00_08755 [Dehalococcoidia bacterium]|nr:hypothetical protein [Dehalococcoidia bacterium]
MKSKDLNNPTLNRLHTTDRIFIDSLTVSHDSQIDSIYLNDSRWWQNASFALPCLIAVISTVVGLIFGIGEAWGFGLFAFGVTLFMLPIVLVTWRNTATSIILTDKLILSLHRGKILHSLEWVDLTSIEQIEYLGTSRFKLKHGSEGEFMTIDNDVENATELVDRSFELSGLPRQQIST